MFQNVLEFARRESSKIYMDICKYIILDLTKRKLVVNKGKVGQGELFKLVNQTCKEKDTPSSKD